MSLRFEIGVHRVVHDSKNGWSVRVMPDRDFTGLLAVDGGEEFGKIALPPELAVEVANAMLACAREMIERGSSTDRMGGAGNKTGNPTIPQHSAETNRKTTERVIVTLRATADKYGMTVTGAKYRVNQRVLAGEWRILPRNSNSEPILVEMPASDWDSPPPTKWARS